MTDIDMVPGAPQHYREALAKAVEWLGDRYLLAHPINAPAVRTLPRARPYPRLRQATSRPQIQRRYRQWLRQSSAS